MGTKFHTPRYIIREKMDIGNLKEKWVGEGTKVLRKSEQNGGRQTDENVLEGKKRI